MLDPISNYTSPIKCIVKCKIITAKDPKEKEGFYKDCLSGQGGSSVAQSNNLSHKNSTGDTKWFLIPRPYNAARIKVTDNYDAYQNCIIIETLLLIYFLIVIIQK